MFIMWSIDDKVDCSAAVVLTGLSLAGFVSLTCAGAWMGSEPGSGVRLLGLKAQRCHLWLCGVCQATSQCLNLVSGGANILLTS